jgi:5-methyltetrahydrofolate--homocysteine methyltransferase
MGIVLDRLSEKKILVSDGAWGTYLMEKGLNPGECPELWNVTKREVVLGIANGYCDEGIDMVETNSFGGSRFKLRHYGLEERVHELNKVAAEISREAAGQRVVVLGSIGPTGKILLTGEVTGTELYDAFAEQAIALESGGADAACIETMSDIEEALCAIRAVKENTGLEIVCTFTFERTRQGEYRTMMGISPIEMARVLLESGVPVIGANCGNGIKEMVPIVKQIRQYNRQVPILIHPNAGMPILQGGETSFCETPEEMARWVPELIEAGANIIGGCCGTTTSHIRAIKNAVKAYES